MHISHDAASICITNVTAEGAMRAFNAVWGPVYFRDCVAKQKTGATVSWTGFYFGLADGYDQTGISVYYDGCTVDLRTAGGSTIRGFHIDMHGYQLAKTLTADSGAGQPNPDRVFLSGADAAAFQVGDYVELDDADSPAEYGRVEAIVTDGTNYLDLEADLTNGYQTDQDAKVTFNRMGRAVLRGCSVDVDFTDTDGSSVFGIDCVDGQYSIQGCTVTLRASHPSATAHLTGCKLGFWNGKWVENADVVSSSFYALSEGTAGNVYGIDASSATTEIYVADTVIYARGGGTAKNINYGPGPGVLTWNENMAGTFHSEAPTGTPPLTVASTTTVSNLNADLLDGEEAAVLRTNLTIVPYLNKTVITISQILNLTGSDETYLFVCPSGLSDGATIVDVGVLSEGGFTGHDTVNWTFEAYNLTAGASLGSRTATSGNSIVADAVWWLGTGGDSISADDAIEMRATRNGSATSVNVVSYVVEWYPN